jgi:tryptophan-rich sensory protein
MVKVIRKKRIISFIICIAIVCFVAILGSIFTSPGVKTSWYQSIKPDLTPPDWVFPIAWTVIFLLIGYSLYYAWQAKKHRAKVAILFGINFIFNVAWSYLYFGMQNPLYAFYDIIALWLSIDFMIFALLKIDKRSSLLLIPYFLWVSFASILNYLSI